MNLIELPPERWGELAVAYEGCRSDTPLPIPKPEHSVIIAAEQDSRIVGVIGAERTWQVSPLWIEKEYRGKGLAAEMVKRLREVQHRGPGRDGGDDEQAC